MGLQTLNNFVSPKLEPHRGEVVLVQAKLQIIEKVWGMIFAISKQLAARVPEPHHRPLLSSLRIHDCRSIVALMSTNAEGDKAWVWSTVAFCAIITGVQVYHLWHNYTKLRAFCFVRTLTTDGCAALNLCRLYNLIPEYGYISAFMFCNAMYVLFYNVAFLDLGKRFYPDGRLWGEKRNVMLLVVFIFGGTYLILALFTSVFYLVIHRIHETYFVNYCISYGLTMMAGLAAANYAFSPLMTSRRKRKTTVALDAYTIGFWYLGVGNMCSTLYGTFYIIVLANGPSQFMLPRNHAADFVFRYVLAIHLISLPSLPPRKSHDTHTIVSHPPSSSRRPQPACSSTSHTLAPHLAPPSTSYEPESRPTNGRIIKPKSPSVTRLHAKDEDEYEMEEYCADDDAIAGQGQNSWISAGATEEPDVVVMRPLQVAVR
ncbi:hypothetical protein BC938DRAFT_480240 [Jimgerdemannia flammicorona]|uniref:Uncharacterized protein n=1 Tax=Jimgerdemannia flammicorona TaxID=994334 RepID=A0A433QIY2_9FUNG|nr:hypothetical protein BC938DRAFT_480240 [Jimgerdemannia flammicorona]